MVNSLVSKRRSRDSEYNFTLCHTFTKEISLNSYGELGSVIIHQTLYNLFPPSDFDPTLIAPLTPPEFIQRILVPEAAVGLIMEDQGLDINDKRKRAKAIDILRESVAYGVAMFPDADTNVSGRGSSPGLPSGKSGVDWYMGVGDEIVKERARARRRELEEEERVEEEMRERREREQEDIKSKGKRKGKGREQSLEVSESSDASRSRARPRKIQPAKLDEHASDASDASERSKGTRPRPRPRPIRSDENTSSDPSEQTCPKPRRVQQQTRNDDSDSGQGIQTVSKSSKTSLVGSLTIDVDLCSDSSNSKTNWTSDLGRPLKKLPKKTRAASKTPDLQHPDTDEEASSELELQYPVLPPNRNVTPRSSIISLLSEDEDDEPTPKPKKAPSRSVPVFVPSRAPSNLAKGKAPLEMARERHKDL